MATATARLAASCPTIYRSNSFTICRGVSSATRSLLKYLFQFFNLNIPIRVNAQVGSDLQSGANDLGGSQIGMQHQSASRRRGVSASGADCCHPVARLNHVAGPAQEQ